jgi:pimeloyl-ACP methyl ester carboxylesterase
MGYGNNEASLSDLRRLYCALRRYSAPDVDVILRPFDADWQHLAYRIHQDSSADAKTVFIAHSYGCGWGLQRLAKHLKACSRSIDEVYLIDPVVRWFQVLLPLNLLSVVTPSRMFDYHLPSNVLAAHVWRQVNRRPIGRWVRSAPGVTQMRVVYGSRQALRRRARCAEDPVPDATVTHSTIDGRSDVQASILADIERNMRQWLKKPPC